MARPAVLAPSAASLPDGFRISANTTSLIKSFGKLSRSALIDLVFQWLDEKNLPECRPYLATEVDRRRDRTVYWGDDDTNPYPAAATIEEVRSAYVTLRDRKGGKREVIDRILEGDWRHGVSMRQLALADFTYVEDHPVGHRWTALQLVPVSATSSFAARQESQAAEPEDDDDDEHGSHLPRFHSSTFLKHVQREISSLVKAHYSVYRSQSLPLTFVRIFVVDSPYQYPRQSPYVYTDSSRLIYLAFPDSAPYVYSSLFSLPGAQGKGNTASSTGSNAGVATDTRTLRRIVMDAIPKALSRPQARFLLKPTSLTTKSLQTLLTLRGPWRTNSANGAFTIFADAVAEGAPLDPRLPDSVPPSKWDKAAGTSGDGNGDSEPAAAEAESQKENVPHSEDEKSLSLRGMKRKSKRGQGLSERESPTTSKKRKLAVISRFGTTAHNDQAQQSQAPAIQQPSLQPQSSALDRLQVHLKDPPVPNTSSEQDYLSVDDEAYHPTTLSLSFSGSDVIAGLRQLAELGVIDASRMPSWMTGEEGVSTAVVRNGSRVDERSI